MKQSIHTLSQQNAGSFNVSVVDTVGSPLFFKWPFL
jgi:hypothetical protein